MDDRNNFKSGTIINNISDHNMIFTFIENTAYVKN